MPNSTIPCTCDAERRLERVAICDLLPFQREMKSLSEQRYAQLAESIRRYGFSVPVFIWRAPNGDRLILDGHQRLRVLQREGWEVDGGIPVVTIEAATEREAAEKLLVIASQYGQIDSQGLYEFGEHYQLELPQFDLAALPGIDWDQFRAEFYSPEDAAADPLPDPSVTGPDDRAGRYILVYSTEDERRYWWEVLKLRDDKGLVVLTPDVHAEMIGGPNPA